MLVERHPLDSSKGKKAKTKLTTMEMTAMYRQTSTCNCENPETLIARSFWIVWLRSFRQRKGGSFVTAAALCEHEDSVEIHVARNDCFGMTEGFVQLGESESQLITAIVAHLKTVESHPPERCLEVESLLVTYMKPRIDRWIVQLRRILKTTLDRPAGSEHARSNNQCADELWSNFCREASSQVTNAPENRKRLVELAHICVSDPEIHTLLHKLYGHEAAYQLRRALKFVARPLNDWNMLCIIASQYAQFRNIQVLPVRPRPKVVIPPLLRVSITEACSRLGLNTSTASSQLNKIVNNRSVFERDCAKPYSLHAEMQLVADYQETRGYHPTLAYFGCSKKACLMCGIFPDQLPYPIATRGKHGLCYPAWGPPDPTWPAIAKSLLMLEATLVSKIRQHLQASPKERQSCAIPLVPQSSVVSSISESTIQGRLQREMSIRSVSSEGNARRKELDILTGAALDSQIAKSALDLGSNGEHRCLMCSSQTEMCCKQCLSSRYCSQTCQKADWPSHKLLCKAFATMSPRPSPTHRCAILFPVDDSNPRMIWLACSERRSKPEGYGLSPWGKPDMDPYFGQDQPHIRCTYINFNPIRNRAFGAGLGWFEQPGFYIVLHYRDTFLIDGSLLNKSITTSTILTSGSSPPHTWYSPIIATHQTPSERVEDISLDDFRHVIDHVTSYRVGKSVPRESRVPGPFGAGKSSTAIRGVKICCDGELKLHGSEPFVHVDVPIGHDIRPQFLAFGYDLSPSRCISSISKLLGMPLRLRRYPDSDFDRWTEVSWTSNQNAAHLLRETDLASPGWGWAPMEWKGDIGNVLVVRVDDQDLDLEDVKLMCYFARRKLQPLIEDALGFGFVERSREEVVKFITRENMLSCKEEMIASYMEDEPET